MFNSLKWLMLSALVPGSVMLYACAMSGPLEQQRQFIDSHVLNNPQLQEGWLEQPGFQLYYRSMGEAKQGVAVWVHGTPGSWEDGGRLLVDEALTSQMLLASIDRPGWGRSQYLKQQRLVTNYAQQADLIAPLLQQLKLQYPDKPLIVAGHSLGGSIIPVLALQYPELVDGLLILAASLDPQLSQPRWYHQLAKLGWVGQLIGKNMRDANVEMLALEPELLKMRKQWRQLSLPIVVVQGEDDGLVDPANADFAEQVLNPANSKVVRLAGQGHLLQMQRSELIASCLLALSRQQLQDCGV